MGRLLSDDELHDLGLSPRERLAAALADEGADAPAVYERLARSFTNFIGGFGAWIDAMDPFLRDRHDDQALGSVVMPDPTVDDAALRDLLGAGGGEEEVMAAYDAVEEAFRAAHDEACDTVARALGHVYETYGVDELELAMRDAGDKTLVAWMPRDEDRPPEVRIRHWASMMTGNFATISVTEDDDSFTIVQDPCGTCGHQVERGCYDPDGDLAVVTEEHRITFGAGPTPIYRSHVAVMHYLMPIERSGRVWPVIECPPGIAAAPCRITLMKDPDATPRGFNQRVGLG